MAGQHRLEKVVIVKIGIKYRAANKGNADTVLLPSEYL
jgi:hypothetical protein